MGRRASKRKKRRARAAGVGNLRQGKAHESGPEAAVDAGRPGSCSPAWNSLDEESLLDYAENVAASEQPGSTSAGDRDEVEVAKRLSYLNFSIVNSVPCALEPHNLDVCWPHAYAPGALTSGGARQRGQRSHGRRSPTATPLTDVELMSEVSLTSTGYNQGEEDIARKNQLASRKRASRRRPNKRTKKMRSSFYDSSYHLCHFVRSNKESSSSLQDKSPAVKGSEESSCKRHRKRSKGERFDPISHGGYRGKGKGRGRGGGGGWENNNNRSESTTPVNHLPASIALQCLVDMECDNGISFSTNAAAMTAEMEMGLGQEAEVEKEEEEEEEEEEDSDHTPIAETESEATRPCLDSELYDNEDSELSESTSDSGCEGDDEESSAERVGPGGATNSLPGWWEREPLFISSNEDSDTDQEKFLSILNGAFPHMMAANGSRGPPPLMKEKLNLPEFKHPGKCGIRGSMRKKHSKPPQTGANFTPAKINSKIAEFVQDQSKSELKFAFMSRVNCRTVQHLAAIYRLKCQYEHQRRRLPVASPVLRRTPFTRMATPSEIDPILRNHGSADLVFPFAHSCPTGVRNGDRAAAVVGNHVAPLDESNMGNRMLQGMGWIPGTGLGPEGEGIQEPIQAYVRQKRIGLGF